MAVMVSIIRVHDVVRSRPRPALTGRQGLHPSDLEDRMVDSSRRPKCHRDDVSASTEIWIADSLAAGLSINDVVVLIAGSVTA